MRVFTLAVFCAIVVAANVQRCLGRAKRDRPSSLALVHVLFRHGDRTPDKKNVYPNDPHINETYYPYGYGELTKNGLIREYTVGKELRKRYGKFLGPYDTYSVEGRSTYMNRTKVSLELVLAGLYPPSKKDMFYKHLRWQPIPFTYGQAYQDPLMGVPAKNCPKYAKTMEEYMKSEAYQKMYNKHKKLFEYLTEKTGKVINSTYDVSELLFTLLAEDQNGKRLPSWTKKVYPDAMVEATADEYRRRAATKELRKLGSGFLVKKILQDTELKMTAKALEKRKIYLYSGHEHNIANMLHFLGIYEGAHVPPYGAYIIFEVHKFKNSSYRLKVFYHKHATEKPVLKTLPGCSAVCPVEKFIEMYKEQLPAKMDECNQKT